MIYWPYIAPHPSRPGPSAVEFGFSQPLFAVLAEVELGKAQKLFTLVNVVLRFGVRRGTGRAGSHAPTETASQGGTDRGEQLLQDPGMEQGEIGGGHGVVKAVCVLANPHVEGAMELIFAATSLPALG